jgi:restriction system protein
VGWARTYLKKAGLLTSPKRAHFRISDKGLSLLKEKPNEITSKFLTRYDVFVEFQSIKKDKKDNGNLLEPHLVDNADQTPEESLEYAYQKLHSELSKELLDIVKSCSSDFFERLVIDLLITMGYGGSRKEAGQAMG